MPEGQFENKVGISQESTFGTVIADNGTFVQVDCDMPVPDFGLFQDSRLTNRGSRVRETDDDHETQSGGQRIITLNNWVVRRLDLAEIMYAVMQNVSESASTPFTKTFTWQGSGGTSTTQPDFSSNAGYFVTIGLDESYSGTYDNKFTSCIARKVTLQWSIATGEDGRLRANVEYISGFTASVAATFSGTWAHNTKNFYQMDQPSTVQLNNADIKVLKGEIVYNNNAIRAGTNSSGNAITYALGPYELTGNLLVIWEGNTVSNLADFIAGTTREIDIAVGTPDATGHFSQLIPAAKFTGSAKDYSRAEGQAVNIPFDARHDGTNPIVTVTISDANDQAW